MEKCRHKEREEIIVATHEHTADILSAQKWAIDMSSRRREGHIGLPFSQRDRG